ncbi:MAG: cache domain-containing protein [Stenotrophomonas sp.]|uniref:cache domain-containing protein n=1 Tax=Stenotrophomonas sp. TaxID=69392 RepID=UPI0033150455
MRHFARHLNLQRLIVGLAFLSAGVMLANAVFAAYQVQREQLIASALESNRVYAHKLAQTTHNFLVSTQQQLDYSARVIGTSGIDTEIGASEAHRLQSQTNAFNSVIVVDRQGLVRAASPALPQIEGRVLSSLANSLAIASRAPLVSNPYVSATGKLVLTISQPIFDPSGTYQGYISASIHLKEPNVLHTLLGTHYYKDGSYLYVVGQDGKLLYHPEPDRVGQSALKNEVVRAVSRGEAGAMPTINSHGVHMLAGFAPIPAVHWGIVSQRPVEVFSGGSWARNLLLPRCR